MNSNITDSYMLDFVEQKMGISNKHPIEIQDELSYFQYIHKHLKEVWYGLMIADLMQPPLKAVDNFIKKFADKALDAYYRSVEIDKVSIFKDDKEGKYMPMKVTKIGDFYL